MSKLIGRLTICVDGLSCNFPEPIICQSLFNRSYSYVADYYF